MSDTGFGAVRLVYEPVRQTRRERLRTLLTRTAPPPSRPVIIFTCSITGRVCVSHDEGRTWQTARP